MESGLRTAAPYVAGPLQLAPFRAVSLAPRRVGDPASARAFARPYRAVPQRLEAWCSRGLATRDEVPALYLHEYTDSGLTVRGLVGCLGLTRVAAGLEERRVFPHEGVHPKQVTELAARMAAMNVNPAPILLVHRGPAAIRDVGREVCSGAPERDYVDHAGQHHRVWAITDREQLRVIDAGLADARLLVADGHHRYAAYVDLNSREPRPQHPHGLAMVVDQDETPLFLGAIHRLLHGTRLADLLAAATAEGAHERTTDEERAMSALGPETMVLTDGQQWATVTVELPEDGTMVQLLDRVLLARLGRRPTRIGFAHSVTRALEQVRPGKVTAVLLPAVDLDRVLDVVGTGGLLPEKATSFQPKPSLGSFIRLLDE
jgi:uncharacterized protein (DUF1015 family)